MNEAELERLVVRLIGDGSSFMTMMQQAATALQTTADHVTRSTQVIEKQGQAVQGYMKAAVSGLAGLGAASYLKEATSAAIKAEDTQLKLNYAIQAGGHDVASTTAEYQRFAAQIAATTNVTKMETLGMLRRAEVMGFSGPAAEQMVRDSIGMAAASDESAESMLRIVAAAKTGNVHLLHRVETLRHIQDPQQKLIAANKMMVDGMKLAEAQANTLSGQLRHLEMETAGLTKQFGDLVKDAIGPTIQGARQLVSWFQGLSRETKTTIFIITSMVAGLVLLPVLFAKISAVVMTLVSPVVALLVPIALIGAGIAAWINSVGGFKAAWDITLDHAKAFWEWIKPSVQWLQAAFMTTWRILKDTAGAAWDWVKQKVIDNWEVIKTVMVVVGSLVGAFLLVKGAIAAVSAVAAGLSAAFGVIGVVLGAIFSPIGAIIALIGVATYAVYKWVQSVGGFGAAWDKVKAATVAFWEWIKPVVVAGIFVIKAAWEILKTVAVIVWDAVKGAAVATWRVIVDIASSWGERFRNLFKGFGDQSGITWKAIRDVAVDVIIAIEFGMRNLDDVIYGTWLKAKASFAEYAIPVLEFFGQDVPDALKDAQEEWDTFNSRFVDQFQDFRRQRLRDFANFDFSFSLDSINNAVNQLGNAGTAAGSNFTNKAKKEMHKFDAVLTNSAEAAARVAEFMEKQHTDQPKHETAEAAAARSQEWAQRATAAAAQVQANMAEERGRAAQRAANQANANAQAPSNVIDLRGPSAAGSAANQAADAAILERFRGATEGFERGARDMLEAQRRERDARTAPQPSGGVGPQNVPNIQQGPGGSGVIGNLQQIANTFSDIDHNLGQSISDALGRTNPTAVSASPTQVSVVEMGRDITTDQSDRVEELLEEIRDILKNKPTLEVETDELQDA